MKINAEKKKKRTTNCIDKRPVKIHIRRFQNRKQSYMKKEEHRIQLSQRKGSKLYNIELKPSKMETKPLKKKLKTRMKKSDDHILMVEKTMKIKIQNVTGNE